MRKGLLAAATLTLVVIAVFVWPHLFKSDPGPTPRVVTLLELVDKVASDIEGSVGSADTYKIIPIKQAAWPIGTLVWAERPYDPVSFTACAPIEPAPLFDAPNLLANSYSVDNATAADIGLQSEVQNNLKARVGLNNSNSIDLGFEDPAIAVLAADDLDAALAKPSCSAAIKGRRVLMIRGLIEAKRKFTLKRDNTSRGSVDLRYANFNVSADSGSATLDVTDTGRRSFLAIVSAVRLASDPAQKPQIYAPAGGLIFVQRDEADDPAHGIAAVSALKSAGFRLAPAVEAVPSAKMPEDPGVRYFNDSDAAQANRVLGVLRSLYPSARLTRVSLPAPPGQLEVWLPKS